MYALPTVEYGANYARVGVDYVRSNYFDFLGTPPLEGRTFIASDQADGNAQAVISATLARRLFQDAPAVGRMITVDGSSYVVVGVVESNLSFLPLDRSVWLLAKGNVPVVDISLIRFRDRVKEDVVRKELAVVAARLALAAGESPRETRFFPKGFATRRLSVSYFYRGLIAAVFAVLLVACANLANLQLARGLARSRELALRSAIGASRRQLIQHLVGESAVLGVAGLVLGVILAIWGTALMRATMPPEMSSETIVSSVVGFQANWRVLTSAAIAALVCIVFIGLLPALHVSRVDPNSLLKSGAGVGSTRSSRRRYGAMVVVQIALALPLSIGSILSLKATFHQQERGYYAREYFGYDPFPLVQAMVPIARAQNTVVGTADFAAQVTSAALRVPGMLDATILEFGTPVNDRVSVDDPDGSIREVAAPRWAYQIVSPSFYRTLGIQMERGRDFADGEFDGRSVVIDGPTSRFLFGNLANAVGRAIKFGDAHSNAPWLTIVGVAGDLRDTNAIRRADPNANFHMGRVSRVVTQADSITIGKRGSSLLLYARTSGNAELAAIRLERALRAISPLGPSAQTWITGPVSRNQQRFVTALFLTFAAIALSLGAIGVFGIVAYSVAERRRELAVRVALGATARNILRSILREGLVLVLVGIALGLVLSIRGTWWFGAYILEKDGYNSIFYAAIAGMLLAVSSAAAFLPAWRATRIDPSEALRQD